MWKTRETKIIDGIEYVMCSSCKEFIEATTVNFSTSKCTNNGLVSRCRKCDSKRRKELYTPEKGKAERERNKEQKKKYLEENREKRNEQKRLYYQEHKVEIKKKLKEYYLSNKEKLNSINKEYEINNKEKMIAYRKQYYSSDHGKQIIKRNSHIRKARKKNAICTYTNEEWQTCKEHFNNECAYCGKVDKLTQEHVIPLSKGGGYINQNIIPACKSCNCSKQENDMEIWYKSRDYFDIDRYNKILKWIDIKNNIQQLSIL